jgi:adenylyltransferase/sulfurtransferase
VQISAATSEPVDLGALAEKLAGLGRVSGNQFLVRLEVDGFQLTVFADGRAIVGGTDDPAVARTVHAKFVGG